MIVNALTTDTLVLLAALALVLVLLVLLLVRRPRVDLPPEWMARLQVLEGTAQATQLAVVAGFARPLNQTGPDQTFRT